MYRPIYYFKGVGSLRCRVVPHGGTRCVRRVLHEWRPQALQVATCVPGAGNLRAQARQALAGARWGHFPGQPSSEVIGAGCSRLCNSPTHHIHYAYIYLFICIPVGAGRSVGHLYMYSLCLSVLII